MSNIKIGIAISVYNKFDFVATNINIMRKHWSSVEPYISVCCNDPETYKKLKPLVNGNLGINKLTLGEDYKINSKQDLRLRQHDCIRKSISGALENSDYVMHWHADAFVLDENSIIDLASSMKNKDQLFCGRGLWLSYPCSKTRYGDIDDHFFMVNSKHALETKMFDMSNNELVRDNFLKNGLSSEGVIAALARKFCTDEKIFVYSDMSECEIKDNITDTDPRYKDGIPHRRLPPVNLDPIRKFLHCDQVPDLHDMFLRHGINTNLIVES
jgi:hypothetical protein